MRKQTAVFVVFAVALLLGFIATGASAAWQIETVPCTMTPGGATLALDADSLPHIAITADNYLMYVYKDVSGWQEETLEDDNNYFPIIDLDSSGYPHIFWGYYAGTGSQGDLFAYSYAISRKDASGWHYSSGVGAPPWAFTNGQYGRAYAFALDNSDGEHSFRQTVNSYTWPTNFAIYYDDERVLSSTLGSHLTCDLAMDSGNYPHICYRITTSLPFTYRYKDAAGWHSETIDSTVDTGDQLFALALDSYDRAHVSYYDNANKDLKYAYRDATGWHLETIDSVGDVGKYNSIGIDSSDIPHIAYYDATNGDLRHAYRDETGWHLETVDSAGDVGTYASLEIDSLDRPHILYKDRNNAVLKYAVNALGCGQDSDCPGGYVCMEGQCLADDPPAIGVGPYVTSDWRLLPTTPENPRYIMQNVGFFWTFSDDFGSCPGDCTHSAEYQKVGDSEWTALSVSSDAAQGYAWVEVPITGLQNATTYVFRFAVEDCASQTAQSATYYFRVATSDALPVITGGPFVAAGAWPRLARSEQGAFALSQGSNVLWTFSDDYASCGGPVTHRAWYRLAGEESWTSLAVGTDPEGTWYAYVTLPVLDAGTYQLLFDVADCAGQYRTPGYYYFKVE